MSESTIRKLRLNFIRSAMLTLVGVMLSISGLIFLTNAWLTRQNIRNILDYLIENDGRITPAEPIKPGEAGYDYSLFHFLSEIVNSDEENVYRSPEFRYTTRYFAVKFDADEKLVEILDNHISSVTEEEAESYGRAALKRRWKFGRYRSYYYQVGKKADGSSIVVFLDSWIQVRANDRLLYSVFIMIGFGVIVTFVIVWLISGSAIRVELKNAQLQKQFITDASHELKTPLAVIKANTEMQELMDGESEWSQSTLRQVNRMTGLIGNLVQIARAQEMTDGELAQTDISVVVSETADSFAPVAASDGKRLEKEIPDSLVIKSSDSSMRQLTSLLVDNAIKYCDDGGTIKVELARSRRGAVLTVSNDYAEGANVDYSRFFERFYRQDEAHTISAGRSEGTSGEHTNKIGYGIGLSIAESLVKSMKGSIDVSWNKGRILFTCKF